MNRTCVYCQSNQLKENSIVKDWIVENQYLGAYGRLLKEQLIGNSKSKEKRTPIKTVYYCSWDCMEEQAEKEEKELWNKGDCPKCKKILAVINDDCQNLEHKRLGCLLPIQNTPECLKNNIHGKN
jgi:superfamily II RNA helicase